MGKYKEEHGKTRVGAFLSVAAPHILEVVGDALPDKGVLGVIKNLIEKDDKLTTSEKVNALELLNYDLENTKDARDLQKIALQQDDLFSKRIIWLYFGLLLGQLIYSLLLLLL